MELNQSFMCGFIFCMISDVVFSFVTLLLEKAREIRQRRKDGN